MRLVGQICAGTRKRLSETGSQLRVKRLRMRLEGQLCVKRLRVRPPRTFCVWRDWEWDRKDNCVWRDWEWDWNDNCVRLKRLSEIKRTVVCEETESETGRTLCQSVYKLTLSVCLSVRPSVRPASVRPSVCLAGCLSVCLQTGSCVWRDWMWLEGQLCVTWRDWE